MCTNIRVYVLLTCPFLLIYVICCFDFLSTSSLLYIYTLINLSSIFLLKIFNFSVYFPNCFSILCLFVCLYTFSSPDLLLIHLRLLIYFSPPHLSLYVLSTSYASYFIIIHYFIRNIQLICFAVYFSSLMFLLILYCSPVFLFDNLLSP